MTCWTQAVKLRCGHWAGSPPKMADVPLKRGDVDPEVDTHTGPRVWTHHEKMALWPSRKVAEETSPAYTLTWDLPPPKR